MHMIPCLLLASIFTAVPPEAAPPNIVLIISDDAGYADFGFTGCEDFATPNIDRLASEGVICSSGYVSASVCSPSRAGLMTGRYQQRFGHEMNLNAGAPLYDIEGLPLEERTFADHLRERGYRTGALGKWHLGYDVPYRPLQRGFDEYYGCLAGSRSYWHYDKATKHGHGVMRNNTFEDDVPGTYFTDVLADEASTFIMRHASEPFFLYLSFTAVHTPMHAKNVHLEEHEEVKPLRRRKLASLTTSLDEAVGQVLDTLEVTGLSDRTMVIFINDNGGATNNGSSNGQYRGMKGSKWEGGIRVPMLMKWPGHLPAGTVYEEPVISLDLLPTAVVASGGSVDGSIDGVDLVPFLSGERAGSPHEQLFWKRSAASAVREGKWKLIRVEDKPPMLFDLDADPSETTNIAESHPDVVDRLSASIVEWEAGHAEPRWTHGDRYRENQVLKHRMEVQGRDAERKYP